MVIRQSRRVPLSAFGVIVQQLGRIVNLRVGLTVAELVLACLNAFGARAGHDADALEAHAASDVHDFDYVSMLGAGVGADE